MSREKVSVTAAPSAARVAGEELEAYVQRLVEQRAQAAYASGLAEGERQANAAAAAALGEAASRLDAACESALASAARASLDLALEIARQLLLVEIAAGRYDLERIVRDALAASGVGRGPCVVHVHPEDAKRLESSSFRSGTRIEPDPGVTRGSVHVATPQGLLVRDLDEALESIGERIGADLRRVGGAG